MTQHAIEHYATQRLLSVISTGPCACGKMKQADVRQDGHIIVTTEEPADLDPDYKIVRASAYTVCNACSHRAMRSMRTTLTPEMEEHLVETEKRPEGFTRPALAGLKSRREQVAAGASEEFKR